MAENPRKPTDFAGLMRYALEHSAADENRPEPMDQERRQWLDEALTSMTVNIVGEMKSSLRILQQEAVTEDDVTQQEIAIENILRYVDNMDNANDFHKIGGFPVLKECLRSSHSTIRSKTANLIAELTQNNQYCQQAAAELEFIPLLLHLLDNDEDSGVRVKALYALSCLTRHNQDGLKEFNERDGFSSLMRAMQSSTERLRIKSSFLVSCLTDEMPAIKDTLCNMGFVEQLVALIKLEHDSSHEHLLSALCSLVSNHKQSISECRRPELQLEETLRTRINDLAGQEEYLEVVNYCQQLLDVCFSSTDSSSNTINR